MVDCLGGAGLVVDVDIERPKPDCWDVHPALDDLDVDLESNRLSSSGSRPNLAPAENNFCTSSSSGIGSLRTSGDSRRGGLLRTV